MDSTVTDTTGRAKPAGAELVRLAESVDALRKALDVSYRALAHEVGVDHAYLYRALTNPRCVNAHILGLSLTALGRLMEQS